MPGIDIFHLIEVQATQGARQYLADLRKVRESSEPFNETELEEMLVKAYVVGFVAAAKISQYTRIEVDEVNRKPL